MIEVRMNDDGSARLVLVVAPPEKRDIGLDPALATERLFSVLARSARPVTPASDTDQSTQSSPESR
jgi:hypothetical protein